MRCAWLSLSLSGALCVAPALAQAPPLVPVQVQYTRDKGAEACPDESIFRLVASGHLGGRDPFSATAPRRVTVTMSRDKKGYRAELVLYDTDGPHPSDDKVLEPDCFRAIETAGTVLRAWVLPIYVPKAAPPATPPEAPHEDAPAPPAPVVQVTPPAPLPVVEQKPAPASVVVPKPPDSPAGKVWVVPWILLGFSGASGIGGAAFAIAANKKTDEAQALQGPVRTSGGCYSPSPGLAGDCRQLKEARQLRDSYANASEGFLIGSGALAVAGAVSIVIVRMPGTGSVQLKAMAPRSLAGLSAEGTW